MKTLLSLLMLSLALPAVANTQTHFKMLAQVPVDPQSAISNATEEYFDQSVDHASPAAGTFKQRYFVNSQYADGANSPVFFLICGEYSCERDVLINGIQVGAVDEYVKEFHAHLVILEHRYYGKSRPFADLSTEHLKFLTTDQAIEDMASFHEFVSCKLGLTGKWIAVGGSYAGNLAAYVRLKHPEFVAGALSSSGPVRAKIDFWEYDRHMTLALPVDCQVRAREMVAYFEGALQDANLMAELRKDYQVNTSATDLEFLDNVEGVLATAVQYGTKNDFCKAILADDPAAGWLAQAKSQGVAGPLPDMSDIHDFDDGARQWTYQTCVEYGYFQRANSNPSESLMPRRADLAYEFEPCQRFFGISAIPATEQLNHGYFEQLFWPATSGILFTNAQDDPWMELGITPMNGQAYLPSGSAVYLYNTLAHHGDLKATTPDTPVSVLQAKGLFRMLAHQWLGQ